MRIANATSSFSRHNRRSGYVLVVTVMLLAVTALIVMGITRHSLNLATSAKIAESNLQEKWAVASCQRYCLTNGETILDAIDGEIFKFEVNLSGLTLANEINDESAKLDVNSLANQVGRQELASVIKDITNTRSLLVRLKPMNIAGTDAIRQPYETWGQVFESRYDGAFDDIRLASQKLTCWGNKLNFRNADMETLRLAIKSVAGSITASRFVAEMENNPEASLGEMLAAIDANERIRRRLNRLLTDRSWATSVWTDIINENKSSSRFVVQQRPVSNIFRYQSFELK